MKKTVAMMMALFMCLSAAGAQALTVTGLETETVSRSWETSLFFSRMQALTGVEVQARGVTDEKEYQALLAGMAQGDIPADVLFKANLTRQQERELLDNGALIDLAPLIEENMPNLSALLAAHPDWMETIALGDGRIASLPLINETERQVCVWINRAWLEKLGLGMPATVDELTGALAAMEEGDPNGNGKHDEAAADLTGVFEMRWLLPYFGIVADDYNLARDGEGSLVFAPELPAYREFIALLRDWTRRGILPGTAFTNVHSTMTLSSDDDETVTSGLLVTMTPYTHVPAAAVTDYEPLLMAGPDGTIRWRDLLGAVWTGCFAVTSACDDPAAALRWVDALYAEEGALLGYAGVEGEDYVVDENGCWTFVTDALRGVNDIRSDVLMYTGAAMPGIYPGAFISSVDSEIDRHVFACNERVRAVSERVTPAYGLDEDAQAQADELNVTLGALVDKGIARFATGELELTDENYEAWLGELRAAGSEALLALFQAAQ